MAGGALRLASSTATLCQQSFRSSLAPTYAGTSARHPPATAACQARLKQAKGPAGGQKLLARSLFLFHSVAQPIPGHAQARLLRDRDECQERCESLRLHG